MNVRFRKVLVEEARLPSRNRGFDSVTGKKNSPVIKGHDGTTHRREWGGRDWLVTRMDELAYRTLPPFISNCCKYDLAEISRLLGHADLHTVELSGTFHQVTYLLGNTTKIVLK